MAYIKKQKSRGIAIPAALLVLILAIGLITSIATMNRGLKSQVYHSSNSQWSFLLAYSAMQRVLAAVHTDSWAHRAFANAPYTESNVALQGGVYDLFVQNTPGRDYSADVYVKTTLAGISRVYFWRVLFNDDLLDISNRVIVTFFKHADVTDFPKYGGSSDFSRRIDDMIAERAANRAKSESLAHSLLPVTTAEEALIKLNGRTPVTFTRTYPKSDEEIAIAGKPAVSPPELEPLKTSELPTAPGPGGKTPSLPDFPVSNTSSVVSSADMDTSNLESEIEKLRNLSKSAYDKLAQGSAVAASYGADGDSGFKAAKPNLDQGGNSINESIDLMQSVISEANSITRYPSEGAKKATEEMVSSAIVSAYQDIVSGVNEVCAGPFSKASEILSGAQTSAEASKLASEWNDRLSYVNSLDAKSQDLLAQISGFSKTEAAAKAQQETQQTIQDLKETISQAIKDAEALAAKLKAKEEAEKAAAEEAARQATENEP